MRDSSKDFNNFFLQVEPVLNDLEDIRSKGYNKSKRKFNYIWASLLISITISILAPFPLLILLLFFIVIGFTGSWLQLINKTLRTLRPPFKKEIIYPLLKYFYDEVVYIPRQRMSINLLRKSLLFNKTVHRHKGEDYTKCKIGNTIVHFSEIQAYNGRDTNYFLNGVFISVQFNKSFKTKTLVLPEKRTTILRKIRLNFVGDMKNARVVKLEDPIFEKEFMVIGEDQVESRYKLSTSLMQRLLDYKNKVNKKVSFSFIDNRLYVLIPKKVDLFEPKISVPINSQEFINDSYAYFELLTGIVEDLDLNTKIWT